MRFNSSLRSSTAASDMLTSRAAILASALAMEAAVPDDDEDDDEDEDDDMEQKTVLMVPGIGRRSQGLPGTQTRRMNSSTQACLPTHAQCALA